MSSDLWYVRDRNKVTGPFSPAQLESLRQRGQLARFHEVSRDRQSWVSAATLPSFFPAPSRLGAAAEPVAFEISDEPPASWFYSLGGQPLGPVSEDDLLGLRAGGKVQADTLVWREGLTGWIPFRESGLNRTPNAQGGKASPAGGPPGAVGRGSPGEAARRKRRDLLISGAIVSAALVVLILGGMVVLGPRDFARRALRLAGVEAPGSIRSVRSTAELSSAVGLVVGGLAVTDFDGSKSESPLATGTCFAVTDQGHLLTSRRVIEGVSRLINAERMRKAIEERTKSTIDPAIWVYLDHQKYLAKLVYESDESDIAVLKVEPVRPTPYFRLSSAADIAKGTTVYALGFPGASQRALSGEAAIERQARAGIKGSRIDDHFRKSDFDYVLTDGIVSIVKSLPKSTKIEHTARLAVGSSGGPLVTDDGTVVGINVSIVPDEGELPEPSGALATAPLRDELTSRVAELFWSS